MDYNTSDIMSEDAMTHGVTVLECEKTYQERYYKFYADLPKNYTKYV